MSEPLVSVVMAVRNVDRFLAEAMESILGQTFTDFEFVIVDFGSTDDSKSIISQYAAKEDRIKFHEIPVCTLPVARNAGCSLARGEYIAVMDADDVSLPDRLAVEVEFMQKHPEVALLGGAVEWYDGTERSLGTYCPPRDWAKIKAELPVRCPFWHPTILLRRQAFLRVGGYRPAFVFAHDYDLELRIADAFECANLKQVVLKYRVHGSQVTIHKRREQTLYKLVAQASTTLRNNHEPDPVDHVLEITPGVLATLGIDEAAIQNTLATDSWNWVRNMTAVGGYTVALDSATQLLKTDLRFVDRWQISELHLAVARLLWKQKRFTRSFLALVRALLTRPALLGRPIRHWLRRVQLRSIASASL